MDDLANKEASANATWRIGLWLDNDEDLYIVSREIVRTQLPEQAERSLKIMMQEAAPRLSDVSGRTIAQADWTEIVYNIREEF